MKKTVISYVILVKFGPVGQKTRNRHSAPPPWEIEVENAKDYGENFYAVLFYTKN